MIGFPFDSLVTYDEHGNPSYDRAVSSKPLKALISKLFTTGVMPNPSDNMQVFAGAEGMTVVVHPGYAVIEGGLKLEEANRTLELQAADTSYDRIDTVVLRWNGNDNARVCDFYVVMGTAAPNPVRPELNRVGSIYEIGLADIHVPANSSVVSQQRITDTRYESARCGIVSSVSEWDTTTIYAQVQSDLADFKEEEQADFVVWYNAIKDRIDSITAQSLQNEIDALSNNVVNSFNTRKGAVTLTSQDVIDALGYTPSTQNLSAGLGISIVNGAIKTKLKSETLSSLTAATRGATASREYPVGLDANGILSVNVPWESYGAGDGLEISNGNFRAKLKSATAGTRAAAAMGNTSSRQYAVGLSSDGFLSVNVPWTDTKTASSITRTATTYVPGTNVEASLVAINKVNTFNLAVATWATNSSSTDYPYKYTISTTEYTANSSPMWMIISNSGVSSIPTKTEMTEGAKVMVAIFSASNIVLYATEKPTVALKLLVKGV